MEMMNFLVEQEPIA